MRIPSLIRSKLSYAASFGAALLALELFSHRAPSDTLARWHLGAEYWNIAQALVDGRGFSDPFGERTGPTSWMPPFLCAFYATLQLLFPAKATVMLVARACADLGYGLSWWVVDDLVRVRCPQVPRIVPLGLSIAWLAVFRYWYIDLSSDVWCGVVVLTLICAWTFGAGYQKERGWRNWLAWAIVGSIALYAAPAAVLPWFVAGGFQLRTRSSLQRFCVAGALTALLASPWVIRNYLVFDRFIPTKGNVGYELYQANVLDDDGVYDLITMSWHPFNNHETRALFARQGEADFVAASGQEFWSYLRANPGEVGRKTVNRALASTLVYAPLMPRERSKFVLPVRRLAFGLPVLCLFVALTGRRSPDAKMAAALWVAYILPYALIAYYMRYAAPLLPLYCMVVCLGLQALRQRPLAPEPAGDGAGYGDAGSMISTSSTTSGKAEFT